MKPIDLSSLSDQELDSIISGGSATPDLSSMSDEELDAIIGGAPQQPDLSKYTDAQLDSLVSQEEKPITEESLLSDPKWIEASRKVYLMNEGPDAKALDNDRQAAQYGLRYMGWFNYNLPKMGLEASQLGDATDDQRKAFVDLMDMYDQKDVSLSGVGRAITGVLADPTTYVGIGTLGAGIVGREALKQGIKQGVKQATKAGVTQGAKIGAIEGSVYGAADNSLRQSARIQAGTQEGFDFGEAAKAASIGAAAGGVLGSAIGGLGGRISGKKYQQALESEKKVLQDQPVDIGTQVAPYDEATAQKVRNEAAETNIDFEPNLSLDVSGKAVDIAIDFMNKMNIPRNPEVQISDQIFDVLQLASENKEYADAFADTLKRNNISEIEFAQLFKLSGSEAGKRLNQLSRASRGMKNISQVLSGEVEKDPMGFSLLRKFGAGARELDNVRRGLLVSQIATSMRNFTAQVGRVGMETLVNGMDDVLNATFNPMRKLFGVETKPIDHNKTLGLLFNLTKDKKFSKDTTEYVTKYLVGERDRLFSNYSSDVADASKNTTFKWAGKITDGLNTLNRMQEYYYRRAMFTASLDRQLRKKNMNIKDVMASENPMQFIAKGDVEKAVNDALEFTYAKMPESKLGKAFIDFANSVPFVTTAVFPFARFMTNAMEFQFKHSPLGPLSLLTEKEMAKVAAGDSKVLAQSLVGTAALMGMIEAKRSGFGGEKWYEIEGTDGKPIDMRPYFPLTPYMLVADLIVRAEEGRGGLDAKDIMQGLTGAQFRGGTGLAIADNLINEISGIDDENKITNAVTRYVSDVLGGFLTPLRMFNDFVDTKQKFRAPALEAKQDLPYISFEDIGQQLKRNIPGLQQTLPEMESPTRAATPGRPETVRIPFTDIEVPGSVARQLTGITVGEAKNPVEKEFDRLGLKRKDILPYTGERSADETMAKYLGPIVETIMTPIVSSEKYQKYGNRMKRLVIDEVLKELRKEARKSALKEDPETFLRLTFRRLKRNIRGIIEEQDPSLVERIMR
jgi:hypothetical protein